MLRLNKQSLCLTMLAAGCLALAGTGCNRASAPSNLYPSVVRFPVRTDWIVTGTIASQPTSFWRVGLLPLQAISLPPSEQDANTQQLAQEVAKQNHRTFWNPRELSASQRQELAYTLDELFGTPSAPRIPQFHEHLQTLTRTLKLDSATLRAGAAIYQNNCQMCHGLTGNGQGGMGASMIPAPRDYRSGRFKFTSSDMPEGSRKPRRDDLIRVLKVGVRGTGMPAFGGLTEPELQAVASYVTFLAIRGETEIRVIRDLLADEEDPIPDLARAALVYQDKRGALSGVAIDWLRSENTPIIPDPDPYTTDEARLAAAARGYAIFNDANSANCGRCHANLGRNAAYTYDMWGTIVLPRNLTLGQYRGGDRLVDIYYRIHSGINGSGMPAHAHILRPTFDEQQRGIDRMWEVVHFVKAVGEPGTRRRLAEKFNLPLD